uniref:G_PROTEIN_RECEP_F1_2 domain-containing protein n=1 Tax=Steinernema glaseri TaxID=37863 RepID=A0A1I7YGU5_9BILA
MELQRMEMLLFFIEGLIVVIVNIPVVSVIFFSPTLKKTKELMFIGGLCLADTVDAFGYVFAGIIRTHMYRIGTEIPWIPIAYVPDGTVTTQLNCFYTSFVILFFIGYQFTAIMTLVVSVDRFAAVFYPSRQMRFSRSARFCVIGAVGTYSVLVWLGIWSFQANAATASSIVSAQCYIAKTFLPPIWGYLIGLRIVCISASVLLYFPIAFRMKKVKRRWID